MNHCTLKPFFPRSIPGPHFSALLRGTVVLASAEEALSFITRAGQAAGYLAGEDFHLALDVAATEFFKDGKYVMAGEGKTFEADAMVGYLADQCQRFPIVSIEDG